MAEQSHDLFVETPPEVPEDAVWISPYFHCGSANVEAFQGIIPDCEAVVEQNESAAACFEYGFSKTLLQDGSGDAEFRVRESYANADAVLAHVGNVEKPLGELFK